MVDLLPFTSIAALIEFAGSLLIIGYILAAIFVLIRTRDLVRARLLVADGVITALSFKVAATLLKTIELHTWQQILIFAAIFALRTMLKRLFVWEKKQLQSRFTSNADLS